MQLLARLLARRFGQPSASVGQRLQRASEEELDTWTEAVLTAESIDAVFDLPAR